MGLRRLLAIVPERWRTAVAADLHEEAARRPRVLRGAWYVVETARVGGRLRWADWRDRTRRRTPVSLGRNWQTDLKLALRSLRREPGSSSAVILTLALGIGATTATYAVFDVAVFRPVPGVVDPDRLVSIYVQPDEHTPTRASASFAHLTAMRADAGAVTGIAAYSYVAGRLQIAADGDPFVGDLSIVTRDYFETLGVRPHLGRLLGTDEYENAAARTIVISERAWRSRFARDPTVVGRPLWVNDVRFTVVGVAADFQGLNLTGHDDFWLPYASRQALEPTSADEPVQVSQMIGRLRPNATLEEARVELARAFASAGRAQYGATSYSAIAFAGLSDGIGLTRARLLTMYRVLMSGVAMLLLLACANAANLLLGQYVARRRSLGLRAAIGATRTRLMREMLVESSLMAFVAGAGGLAIGMTLAGLFRGTKLLSYLPALEDIQLDWRVMASALAAAAMTIGLFAIVPAWLASRVEALDGLRETSRASARAPRLRAALMAVQVSLSLALLVGTALLGQSVAHLRSVDLGFDPHNLAMEDLRPEHARAAAVLLGVRDQIATRDPQGVAVSSFAPLGAASIMSLGPTGPAQGSAPIRTRTLSVSPTFFATMHMPLAGQTFAETDADPRPLGSVGPIVLGESVARRLFGIPTAAVGHDVSVSTRSGGDARHVIGVTSDIVWGDLRAGRQPSAFVPFTRNQRIGAIVMRAPAGAAAATSLLRDAVRVIDPSLPVESVVSIPDEIDQSLAEERLLVRLGGVIAAIAAMLAMAGVYSVMACFVGERTREFGIRRALGASVGQVAGYVLRRVVSAGLAGVLCGAGLAALVARSLAVWLFGVRPVDVPTIASASVALLAIALVAAALPAWRATKVDPAVALRTE